jgi:hypothetical protein
MLSPFTAGWQSTDIHPLIIDKSEVYKINAMNTLYCVCLYFVAGEIFSLYYNKKCSNSIRSEPPSY